MSAAAAAGQTRQTQPTPQPPAPAFRLVYAGPAHQPRRVTGAGRVIRGVVFAALCAAPFALLVATPILVAAAS